MSVNFHASTLSQVTIVLSSAHLALLLTAQKHVLLNGGPHKYSTKSYVALKISQIILHSLNDLAYR